MDEILARLDRICDRVEPIFDSGNLHNVTLSAEDVAAILIISFAFARATPAREDWTDEELEELECHAERLVRLSHLERADDPAGAG